MIPAISLQVAAVGTAVCLYIAFRMVPAVGGEGNYTRGEAILAWLGTLAAILGVAAQWIMVYRVNELAQ